MSSGGRGPGLASCAVLSLVVSAAAACAGRPPNFACAPVADTVPLVATASGLAGRYDLSMIATDGPAKGDTARGALRLQPSSPARTALPGVGGAPDEHTRAPLYGATGIDVRAVGGLPVGVLDTADEASPGVLVIERTGDPHSILLRLGSEANVRDRQPAFDGGYTVLEVRAVTGAGFRGSWRSGVTRTDAEGYFCAVRREE